MPEVQSLDHRERLGRRLAVGAAIAVAAYSGWAWLVPPELFNDTAAGYQLWLSMLSGGPFNSNVTPSAANLAESVASFQPWWAPGQYLVPGVFHVMGLPLGRATVVVVALGSLSRIFGYWRLWLAWGVPPRLAAECGAIAMLVRPFSGYFGNAYVADVLQSALVPWLVLLVWRWRELRGWQCLALIIVLLLGVGVKLSLLVAVMSMLGGTIAEGIRTDGTTVWRRHAIRTAKAALIFGATKLIWDLGYLHRGASIGAGIGLSFLHPVAFTQPLAGPLFSALGVQSVLNRIFIFPGAPWLTPEGMWPFFLGGALATVLIVKVAWRTFPARGYVVQVLVWLAVYGAVFAWFYVTKASVSFEERHYLPAGMLLLPCTVFALRHAGGRAWRCTGTGILVALCAYGLVSFAMNVWHRARDGAVGRHEFTHTTLTRGALAELRRLDEETAGDGTVFYVTMPEIALEVRRGRPLTVPADWWSEEMVRSQRFAGRVPRLVLVLPKKFADNGKVDLVQREFTDYHFWETHEVDGFLFIVGS